MPLAKPSLCWITLPDGIEVEGRVHDWQKCDDGWWALVSFVWPSHVLGGGWAPARRLRPRRPYDSTGTLQDEVPVIPGTRRKSIVDG